MRFIALISHLPCSYISIFWGFFPPEMPEAAFVFLNTRLGEYLPLGIVFLQAMAYQHSSISLAQKRL